MNATHTTQMHPWAPGARPKILRPETMERLAESLETLSECLTADGRNALRAALTLAGSRGPHWTLSNGANRDLLDGRELAFAEGLAADPPAPDGQPMASAVTVIMKSTLNCNLACPYCYFTSCEKNDFMPFEVLATATKEILTAPGVKQAHFCWVGGEPTLLPPAYYKKAIWLQNRFKKPWQTITNSMSTNGTRVNDEWIDLWAMFDIRTNISLDGSPEIHNSRRVGFDGKHTWDVVVQSLARMKAAGIEPTVNVVVDRAIIALGPAAIMANLAAAGARKTTFLFAKPSLHELESGKGDRWPGHVEYEVFMRSAFEIWWEDYRYCFSVTEFSMVVSALRGKRNAGCWTGSSCFNRIFTIDPRGEVLPCDDFFGSPDYQLGNIMIERLSTIASSKRVLEIMKADHARKAKASKCGVHDEVCEGGCAYIALLRDHDPNKHHCCGETGLMDVIAKRLGLPYVKHASTTAKTSGLVILETANTH